VLNSLAGVLNVLVAVMDSVASFVVIKNPAGIFLLADLAISQA
jgi:hypothetical protein